MHPSRRFQEFHTDKKIFPPPPSTSSGNPIGDFPRKYNFTTSGQPSDSPATVIGCGFSRGPNDKMNGLCRNNVVNGFASNQPEELLNLRYPNENGYWNQSNLVAPWQPNERNLQETSGNAIYTSSLSSLGQLQSIAKVLAVLPPSQGHENHLKVYESSEITGKSHNKGQVQDFPRYGQSGHLISNFSASGEIPEPSSELPLVVENLQNRSLDPRMMSAGVEGQVSFQESTYIQPQSGAHRGLDSSNPSIDGRKLPEFHKEQLNDIFVQNQLQITEISSDCAGGFLTSNVVEGDTEIGKTLPSAASSLIQPLKEETSTKKVETDLMYGNELENKERTSSIKADNTVACKASEKLWNGTLQLSSSAKLSAAAYFRSGDKMPDIYWSDSVEVRGKVKLEAFEKYIQELPRSRNRGLMVTLLCLIEGSSKDGLKGMNEVIKKYKNGKRVGRANLSPGVDVYICPNSEAIITILANNGFSKGLETVQDYQDSMIGCVVWRKNSSSDPGSRKLGNESLSGRPLSSSPNSNPQQVTGSDSSPAKPRAEDILQASAKAPATYRVVANNSGESKNTEYCAHPEVGSISSSSPSPGASTNLHSSTPDGPPSDLHDIHRIVKQLTEIEASIFQSLGIENLPGNLQLLKTILPSSSEVVKQHVPVTEDDDLPEYDFGAALPHASASNALEAVANGEFIPSNELVTSTQRNVEAQKDVYGGPLPQKRKAHVVDSGMASSPVREQANKTNAKSTSNNNPLMSSKTKNLFDEDDMPEWQPPDMIHFQASIDQTTRPPFVSNTFRSPHSGVANPTSSHMPTPSLLGPPPPLRSPPFRPAGRPQQRPYNTREPINHSRWSHR